MDRDSIIKEFKKYVLNEEQIVHIIELHKETARLMGVSLSKEDITSKVFMRIAMNSIKFTVLQILELSNARKEDHRSETFKISQES